MIATRWRFLVAAGLLGALLAPAAPAQEEKPKAPAPQKAADTQEELIKKRDAKMSLEFLKKADWITDYDKAREEAKKSGKKIFAYFTRSYAH